ncbi:GTP 3',8-cyclase MoaA [Rhodospirillum rubrum]|uniref:GTP 3',8-cyclase MoaA n=1 Tax=Rhodospirillum rubrum TaxID=1085 RepID=UPI001F5BC999|nr:GTP 3',8-cyclase MoaA [Rhodospirillum rubrum]MBK1676848.1 GTP 3',8-cyclase MoaA [Rhodospirillum rubrum]
MKAMTRSFSPPPQAAARPLAEGPRPLVEAPRPLVDAFGRTVSYLRLSVTDRCDLRCAYCMAEDMVFLPKRDLLSLEELETVALAFIRRGVCKIRITGGEPLHRRGLMGLIENLGRTLRPAAGECGLDELTLTTNATRLAEVADDLAARGVRRINVSLDTLRPERFRAITRRGDLDRVMAGLAAAGRAGLAVKINTVALRGVNEDEIDALLGWCGTRGYDLTFIETMPLGDTGTDRIDQYLPLTEVQARLKRHWTLSESTHRTGGPARYWDCRETGTRLGFITPLTHNFCEGCNRVRLTCTGMLYLCLGQDDSLDLRAVLREGGGAAALDEALDRAMAKKPKGHDFIIDRTSRAPAVSRHMSATGG